MKDSEQMMPTELASHFKDAVEKTVEKPEKGDDDLLLSLATSDGWELLMSIVDRSTDMMEATTKQLVSKATSWEETAKIYFARDVAVASVKAITDVVLLRLSADEANEEPDKTE